MEMTTNTTTTTAVTAMPTPPTVINLMNVCKREDAQSIIEALDGKTYMYFRVTVCPDCGSFAVNAETDYRASREEITSMLLMVLSSSLMKVNREQRV